MVRRYKAITIVCILILLLTTGCESMYIDGFSAGVILLNTDITTDTMYGQQTTRIRGAAPVGLVNIKFK